MAMNCVGSPTLTTLWELGMMVMEVRPRATAVGDTVTVAVPLMIAALLAVALAMMVAVPVLLPIASPAGLMEATLTSLDFQVTWPVRSRDVGLAL